MLENVIKGSDQQIYTLREEFKQMEEMTPISVLPTCIGCENVAFSKSFDSNHNNIKHPDENLPSTSKCGVCEVIVKMILMNTNKRYMSFAVICVAFKQILRKNWKTTIVLRTIFYV